MASHRQRFNKVDLDDFDFTEVLGEGGFGVVLHSKKKSTGIHYAMKIQCKRRMLAQYPNAPQRVTYEKEAVSKCHHPFIIGMDYAFQTKRLAIMVTVLGTGDSLAVLSAVSEERALFYTAEIALALDHIHKMGMIYRDLKPANVLLNEDGHIQLVDLGGVVDVEGNTLEKLGYYDDPDDVHAVLFNDMPPGSQANKSWFKKNMIFKFDNDEEHINEDSFDVNQSANLSALSEFPSVNPSANTRQPQSGHNGAGFRRRQSKECQYEHQKRWCWCYWRRQQRQSAEVYPAAPYGSFALGLDHKARQIRHGHGWLHGARGEQNTVPGVLHCTALYTRKQFCSWMYLFGSVRFGSVLSCLVLFCFVWVLVLVCVNLL